MNFNSPVVSGEASGPFNVIDLDHHCNQTTRYQPEEAQKEQSDRTWDENNNIDSKSSSSEKVTKLNTANTSSSLNTTSASSSHQRKEDNREHVAVKVGPIEHTPQSPSNSIPDDDVGDRCNAIFEFCSNLTWKSFMIFILGFFTCPLSIVPVLLVYLIPIWSAEWVESQFFAAFSFGSIFGAFLLILGVGLYVLH